MMANRELNADSADAAMRADRRFRKAVRVLKAKAARRQATNDSSGMGNGLAQAVLGGVASKLYRRNQSASENCSQLNLTEW